MNPSGTTYYSWTTDPKNADPTMISGFLTAINMFADTQQGEQIKEITLNKTTYIFDRSENMVVVILTQDPEFQNVIRLVLPIIRQRFYQHFHELISNFNGDIAPFQSFTVELEDILTTYGYFNYQAVIPKFEQDETIECVLYLDNATGKVLYIKSKKYLDRDLLGFQTMVLIKSLHRAIDSRLKDKLEMILLLTNEGRFIEIMNYDTLSIVYESKQPESLTLDSKTENKKKWKKILKKREEFTSKLKNPIVIYDEKGNIQLLHDLVGLAQLRNIPADTLTTHSSGNNIVQSVYKENLFGILVLGSRNMYFLHFDEPYFVFSVLDYAECSLLQEQKSNILSFKVNLSKDSELSDCINHYLSEYMSRIA